MFPTKEKKILEKLLRLAPEPEHAFNYDELCGFLFGLAMTPDHIPPDEWIPLIFGGDLPDFKDPLEMEKMAECLVRIYNQLFTNYQDDSLIFPFDIDTLHDNQIEAVYAWVSGLEEALALREELWDPEEFPKLLTRKKEDLMHSIMIIQGLVDPSEMLEMFEQLPSEVFQETFPDIAGEFGDREMQLQVFLLATLPLAIDTLQNHARSISKMRRKKTGGQPIPLPIRPTKKEEPPCSCPSGGSCCTSPPSPKKEAKIIKVDFSQRGKSQSDPAAPIFQLKISLQGAKPPIWRRIQVPGDTTLDRLHKVIQLCMGWTDSHLHQFIIDRTCYNLPDMDNMVRTSRPKNEAKFTLHTLQDKILPGFQYIYDYGDDWLHQIQVEKVLEPKEGKPYPTILAGKRACPPEDVGGISGLSYLLEVLGNPEHESLQEYREWLDEEYDPARFGKEEIALINAVLEEMYA